MNKYECGLLAVITGGFFAFMSVLFATCVKDSAPTAPFADVATNGWRLARIATEPIDGGVRLTLDLMDVEVDGQCNH